MGIFSLDPAVQVILLPVIIFALSLHEFAHGWVAYRLGDPTAKFAGRLTLNPMAHLDPFGAIALYFMGFGWAKPVPVDPRYLSYPKKDMMWIALAGPASNFLLALASGLLLALFSGFSSAGILAPNRVIVNVIYMSLYINLALGIFNFLPIPPLDGSKILGGLLPYEQQHYLVQLEMYGPKILLGIILIGVFTGINLIGMVISPIIGFFANLFTFGIL